mmetsp:Transcript_19706/g.27190  ORF Transcript_19706/g.27190 Transcript_19706/m.27190 type:complete len:599 (+) Transcript_19706:56-1852(+)
MKALTFLFLVGSLELVLTFEKQVDPLSAWLPSLGPREIKSLKNLNVDLFNKNQRSRKEKALGGTSGPNEYNWPSWLLGPPCPNRSLEVVDPDLLVQSRAMALAFADLTAAGKLYIAQMSLVNLTVGMTMIAVYNDTIIYQNGFGVEDIDTKQVPDIDTVYNIGSVTKIFTSALYLKLKAEGLVTLDQDGSAFFNSENPPEWNIRNPYRSPTSPAAGVSLHSLASQTSGLPRESPCGVYCAPDYGAQENFDLMNDYYSVMFPPYSKSHYSNLGFTLLGRSMERAVDVLYEDYIVTDVLSPLGMQSSGFNYTEEIKSRMATGYTITSPSPPYQQVESSYNTVPMNWSAPAGGMYSTARDIATYMSFLFRDVPNNTPSGGLDSLNEYLSPGENEPDGLSAYGLMGWEEAYDNGRWVLTKGGLVDGFATSIAIDPDLKLGVGVFINFPNGAGADALTASMIGDLTPAILSTAKDIQPVKPLPTDYKSFLGSYGGIVIMEEGDLFSQGFLQGNIVLFQSPVRYYWDPEQDFDLHNTHYYGFRFSTYDQVFGENSCFAESGLGTEGVLFFTNVERSASHTNSTRISISTVTYPDLTLFNFPKTG